MNLKSNIIYIVIILTLCFSCTVNNSEITIIEINAFKDNRENELLAKDLVSYNYPQLFAEKTKIGDERLRGNVRHEYFIQKDTKEVSFRLILKNEALELKDKVVPFFKGFVTNKQLEHKNKSEEFEKAIQKSLEIITIIENNNYDTLSNIISPTLKEVSSEEEFISVLKKRNQAFLNAGKRTFLFKQTYSEAGGFKGDFYVIYYEYEDKTVEHITLEYLQGEMKLMGYQWYMPNK